MPRDIPTAEWEERIPPTANWELEREWTPLTCDSTEYTCDSTEITCDSEYIIWTYIESEYDTPRYWWYLQTSDWLIVTDNFWVNLEWVWNWIDEINILTANWD
jgi:hypothetical protein